MTFKRRVLSALGKDELLEIGRGLDLEITTRMSVDELRDVLASSKRASLSVVIHESLQRDTLKAICRACGLDDTGREKHALAERIIAAGETRSGSYKPHAQAAKGIMARERSASYSPLRNLDQVPVPRSLQAKVEVRERRRGGVPQSDSVVSGSLKAALRQFALGAAGGYRGREAPLSFTTHLLECFGWKEGRPEGAEVPRTFAIADGGQRVEREVALWWPARRVMMEVAPHDAVLDFAWKDLVRVCLQLEPSPQYVVLTNQRDLQLYDLARDREAARLSIPIDDLPKYSEAFPFFTTHWIPGTTPRIVNVEKVSAEVADLVAKLYRSVRGQHAGREHDVIRFTLQCITAMFAEDIGLLPKSYFTSLLYDGAKHRDVEQRLRALFVQMNTRDLPAPRVVPYFNGGLFTDAVTLPLGSEQLIAMTKAAEADWTYVDPHIFGSVFQGIMDDAERHASGAHYTAHDDIMRVVGPTIVEPWRRRIQAATSLKELSDLRAELFRYRVLDPACGSGNFLYVSFREIYRLDTELLSRMREFPSTHGKLSWNGGIQPSNFFGMDINPFAVELAKVTLNIAKKIAFEERRAQAEALSGQVEMDVDPSLPLDNLDKNIVRTDALFTDWPEVDAIVGNPPFLGGQKIRKELGAEYMERLQSETGGLVDLACYFFRRAHDRLRVGGRAGLVATSGIRVGKAKAGALDYIIANQGTITNAVSSVSWPGEAAVNVSMVNWTKGPAAGPFTLVVDGQAFPLERIPSHLQLFADLGGAKELRANDRGTSMPPIFGHSAFRSGPDTFAPDAFGKGDHLKPVATADGLLRGTSDGVCIWLAECDTEEKAKVAGGDAFKYLKKHVYTLVNDRANSGKESADYKHWLRTWWKGQKPRLEFLRETRTLPRIIACSRHASRPIFMFLSREFLPTESLQLFGFSDDYTFGVLQSHFHWKWTVGIGSKIADRIRYTTDVWRSFPWPQDPTDQQVAAIAATARELRRARDDLRERNSWSLRALYQAAEVEGPHPLKDAQAALDAAVRDAYGVPSDQDPIAFLLELNQLVAEDEEQGRKVRGPGLPDHVDPKDPRWTSTDCIEPPKAN